MIRSVAYAEPSSVALPKNRKRTTTLLLVLSIFFPPLALYLDGATGLTVLINLILWLNFFLPAVVHAIVYVLRPQETRNRSRPCRYRLWVENAPGTKPHEQASKAAAKEKAMEDANPENPFKDPTA
ncbi:hypothetical protein K505DRAFT_112647 [Melanomma pulvis-pyrius CBS 109.77]|uniref:Uncharacterized protein n=1 Tax=Melanomma pulvis-pyrius CBS 109.77 TaxID=1314802 RepID=A0A6A6WVL4_9PLEO|nr:hypothetical protein K505DRAFT_112647 [Melanomma pulvis-pyrius CBS 109.77]